MEAVLKKITGFIQLLMVISLVTMFLLIFGNVVLRYLFDSGIPWASELSRYLFVWMVFLGIILGVKDNEHLAVDMFVKRFPPILMKLVYVIGVLIMLFILFLFFQGSIGMTTSSLDTRSPATGIPLAYVYGIGLIASIGMALMLFRNLYIAFTKPDGVRAVFIKERGETEENQAKEGDSQ